MIAFPAGAKVWIAGGATDMRCGMNSLALKVQRIHPLKAVWFYAWRSRSVAIRLMRFSIPNGVKARTSSSAMP